MQRVSQKQIASYIGVTPEFFNKMKSKTVEGIKKRAIADSFFGFKISIIICVS